MTWFLRRPDGIMGSTWLGRFGSREGENSSQDSMRPRSTFCGGTGNESVKHGCHVLHHVMYFLRIFACKLRFLQRFFVATRIMEPYGTRTTNAVQPRARNDANLCKNASSNKSLEYFERSSREGNRLSLYSYIGTVVFSFLIFLRWFIGILFLGPAQQVWRTFDHNFISSRNGSHKSKTSRVFVIDNVSSCDELLQSYRSQYPLQLNFLGMDCEWVNKKGQTNTPVALLQIATPLSDCFLIRLCKMDGHLPQSVREILEDKNILKFGVGIKDDAKRLSGMFGIDVLGCVDLRHVIQRCRVESCVQSRYMVKSKARAKQGLELLRIQTLALVWPETLMHSHQPSSNLNLFKFFLKVIDDSHSCLARGDDSR